MSPFGKVLRFYHEDDIASFCDASIILHNMSMREEDCGDKFLTLDELTEDKVMSEKFAVGK